MLAGVELGGTKVVAAIGRGPGDLVARTVVPTTEPGPTLDAVADFLRGHRVDALGLASFGPLDLDPASDGYGRITWTPKRGWEGTDLLGRLGSAVGVPVGVDTDVAGAALAEQRWGAGAGARTTTYVTVGTGVGGATVEAGRVLHGRMRPELGHLDVVRMPGDELPGVCRFHGGCLEGLASGPALHARFGRPGQDLRGADLARAVGLEAWYLGQLARTLVYLHSPDRLVLGGGVPKLPGLLAAVRRAVTDGLAGAIGLPEVVDGSFLVTPALGDDAGVLGGLLLAEAALRDAAAS
ncbi:ROK family protein [Angustibacter aerolatus]